ncbi:hypothetical protein ELG88_29145 (plasmid) [Rhizobium leguminosarum]|nr:hypothetical protein ELG88_29145 [Rhizobium leguminosarum]TBF69421.1 hypothetical protein ELG86_31390 [Rhizobium leguminosarum]TBG01191.1 hypothetical protein ELG85_21715 [Rhizobium leguminosarum]TBG55740.1 hypothetical protein ELG74_30810 [Rhizobium leguminosarum]TBG96682.1 hypothetical protein ELG70_28345 [Rhizobium leguminosarum]
MLPDGRHCSHPVAWQQPDCPNIRCSGLVSHLGRQERSAPLIADMRWLTQHRARVAVKSPLGATGSIIHPGTHPLRTSRDPLNVPLEQRGRDGQGQEAETRRYR